MGIYKIFILFVLTLFIFPFITFAQTNCPVDPENYSNQDILDSCSIGEISNLSEERLMTFSSEILTQISTDRLQQFNNKDLTMIAQATADPIGFLSRFSNDRLLKFDNPYTILQQLSKSRIKTFSCDIQQRLGYSCGEQVVTPTPLPINTPQPSFSAQPKSSSSPKKPVKIIISQFEREDQVLDSSQNLNEAKINLNFNDQGIANVRFKVDYDSTGQDSEIYYIQYKLKQKQPLPSTGSNEFLVDIIIHKSLVDQEETLANWATNVINNTINTRFQDAGIAKKLRVNKVIKNYHEDDGCLLGGITTRTESTPANVTCKYSDGKIRVWLYKQNYGGNLPSTSADQGASQVFQSLPSIESGIKVGERDFWGKDQYEDVLTHEIGHLFALYDYYLEEVSANNNKVVRIGIQPYVKDIMYSQIYYTHFSPTSREIVNRVLSLPPVITNYPSHYLPKQVVLKITDNNGISISNIKVELFQQIHTLMDEGRAIARIIPDKVKFHGLTDERGEYVLGSTDDIYGKSGRFDSGMTAFLRITKENEVRYLAITYSYLVTLYFEGQINTAVITKKFSELVAYAPDRPTVLSGNGSLATEVLSTDEDRKLLESHLFEHLQENQSFDNQNNSNSTTTQPISKTAPGPLKLIDFNGDGVINSFDYSALFTRILGR